MLASLRAPTALAQEAAAHAALTQDVYTGDFPPANYGQSHEAIEATIQEVVERVFRDEDGILRSGVKDVTIAFGAPIPMSADSDRKAITKLAEDQVRRMLVALNRHESTLPAVASTAPAPVPAQ